jgi:hypothetical protein
MTDTPQQYVARLVATAASELADPPSAQAVDRLVGRVERASVPGRGTGASQGVRLAVGLLAAELLARDPGPARTRRLLRRAPRRGVLLVGSPLAVAATRDASGLRLLPPAQPTEVVVVGRSLDDAFASTSAPPRPARRTSRTCCSGTATARRPGHPLSRRPVRRPLPGRARPDAAAVGRPRDRGRRRLGRARRAGPRLGRAPRSSATRSSRPRRARRSAGRSSRSATAGARCTSCSRCATWSARSPPSGRRTSSTAAA